MSTTRMQQLLQEQKVQEQRIEINDAKLMSMIADQRHKEVAKIESDLLNVKEMFMDLQNLIAASNGDINKISENVASASDHVKGANVEISKADEYHRKHSCSIL